jgi:hypothetical protein
MGRKNSCTKATADTLIALKARAQKTTADKAARRPRCEDEKTELFCASCRPMIMFICDVFPETQLTPDSYQIAKHHP